MGIKIYRGITKQSSSSLASYITNPDTISKPIESILTGYSQKAYREGQNIEIGYLLNTDGSLVERTQGVVNFVMFQSSPSNRIVIHNHPSGHTFSKEDIAYFITNNLQEIRAIGRWADKDLLEHIFSRTIHSHSMLLHDFQMAWDDVYLKATNRVLLSLLRQGVVEPAFTEMIHRKALSMFAQQYRYNYIMRAL